MRLARQEGKTVSPIKGPGLSELGNLPRWLGQIYDLDLAEHRTMLTRVLQDQSRQKRVAMMAPEPPANFVGREDALRTLKQVLLDARGDAVAITAAITGAAGYGKTALAEVLAHDPDIQDAYFDGILWVTLGDEPANLSSIMSDLVEFLSGDRPAIQHVNIAAAKLSETLGDRRILMIVNDAHRKQDLRPFLQGGSHTARLITTPHSDVLPINTFSVSLDEPTLRAAREVLSQRQPKIPAQRPAAVEPVWSKGRLTLPKTPAKSDLKTRNFVAALKSLREELRILADDVAGEANIDRRFVTYLRQLGDQIPQKSPRQTELFRLGHAAAVLTGYAKTVNEQWPDLLAARYHALILHFDRTIRQSPLWREFKRNAAQQPLNSEQITAATSLAVTASNILRDHEANDFIDPVVPQALEQLAEPLQPHTLNQGSPGLIEIGAEQLAYDVVESVNNILKRVFEAASRALTPVSREISSTIKEAAKGWGAEARKSTVKEFKSMGRNVGPALRKWIRRLAVLSTGGSTGYAGVKLVAWLVATYPAVFDWLEATLAFFLL